MIRAESAKILHLTAAITTLPDLKHVPSKHLYVGMAPGALIGTGYLRIASWHAHYGTPTMEARHGVIPVDVMRHCFAH